MSIRTLVAAVALSAFTTACHYTPAPVTLQGLSVDIDELAGEWSGEYSSQESGRSGSIVFKIVPQLDTAYGDVVMISNAGSPLVAADAPNGVHQMHSTSATILRVAFVRVMGEEVKGTLEPYVAPDCQCVVRTVFHGVVKGDRIDGMYTTYGPNGLNQEGKWSVTRSR